MVERPERLATTVDARNFAIAAKPLSPAETILNNTVLRKVLIIAVLAAIWELYGRWLNNQLLVPTFSATVKAFVLAIVSGELLPKVWVSIKVLLVGYGAGVADRGAADDVRDDHAHRRRVPRDAHRDVQPAARDRAAAAGAACGSASRRSACRSC